MRYSYTHSEPRQIALIISKEEAEFIAARLEEFSSNGATARGRYLKTSLLALVEKAVRNV
jgi:hypothetical protein